MLLIKLALTKEKVSKQRCNLTPKQKENINTPSRPWFRCNMELPKAGSRPHIFLLKVRCYILQSCELEHFSLQMVIHPFYFIHE